MKISATIQARMGSTRLPGKVLKTICGKPILQYQVERIKRSRLIDEIIIATTNSPKDDPIVTLAEKLNVSCFRGSENDVLDRVTSALKKFNVDVHVELIGDSPLNDPQIMDEVIGFYLKNYHQYDYVSNGIQITYPSGMETNVYSSAILFDANKRVAIDDPLREHVDIHLYKTGWYRCCNLEAPKWFQKPNIFLEVDTQKDYKMISAVVEYFVSQGKTHFTLMQILDFLNARPELISINQNEKRRYWKFKNKKGNTCTKPLSSVVE